MSSSPSEIDVSERRDNTRAQVNWMYRGHTLSVLIPAFNEARTIGRVLETLPTFVDAVVVVDDGSSDETYAIARQYEHRFPKFLLLRHPKNRGFGAALKTCYTHALRTNSEMFVVMGADGQMLPSDLPTVLDPIVDGIADVVNGDRFPSMFSARDNMPRDRFTLNRLITRLTSLISGYNINDAECGYTAMRRQCATVFDWHGMTDGWGIGLERLVLLKARGCRLANVPVHIVYRRKVSTLRYLPFLADYLSVCSRLLPLWVRLRTKHPRSS